ncbi:cellulose biosynthesis regulator diguanylate cyclase DgcQ [Kalamiella sp. sgz302252]|uniref:cellulose biosynthesis regulator diguanylate cyclase DgcQ n=1 Tax=Pantoea sp. sgz302252 TaxID=3341827 RepID=UPI0036D36926
MKLTRGFFHSRPETVIHVCFLLVLLFSSFLTWREGKVLKETYELNQRASLNDIAGDLDRQFQYSLDQLLFYRNMLQQVMRAPAENSQMRLQLQNFSLIRNQPVWHLYASATHSLPLTGIADGFVAAFPLLKRDDSRFRQELVATLIMSLILQLNDAGRDFHSRLWYVSRAGFWLSSTPLQPDADTLRYFSGVVKAPWFTAMRPESNPQRYSRWSGADETAPDSNTLTLSLPVDLGDYWYGVLAMDFTAAQISRQLQLSLPIRPAGSVLFYDINLTPLASLTGSAALSAQLNNQQILRLKNAITHHRQGALRLNMRYISWVKTRYANGVVIKIDTLKQGLAGDTGQVALALLGMWLLFTLLLLLSHQTAIGLVRRLLAMQEKYRWRANHDGLTKMLNRNAFFERADELARRNQQAQTPFSVIQLDLDHFKQVNDNYGHEAGDRVLAYAAAVIQGVIGPIAKAGRVGGEEFCIVLSASASEAAATAEKVRAALAQKPVFAGNSAWLTITASLGVASSEEAGNYFFENLQSIADRRLYFAKVSGRNRVCAGD